MNLPAEPFWCERFEKYLKAISNEEADRICNDVQLYYQLREGVWCEDIEPWRYASGKFLHPSEYLGTFQYAVEVHLDKPEYEPEQRSCDHDE